MYVSAKLWVENVARGPSTMFMAWPMCLRRDLYPSVRGTVAVENIRFRSAVSTAVIFVVRGCTAPPSPSPFTVLSAVCRSASDDTDAMAFSSCWKHSLRRAAETDWLVVIRRKMSANRATNSGSSNLQWAGAT